MDSSDKAPGDPSGPSKPRKWSAPPPEDADTLLVVTLKVGDGSILKIETVGPDEVRHEISSAEAAGLLGDRPKTTVEGLVHAAFEAGIAWVLDDKPRGSVEEEASGETQEDAALHDELLDSLIKRSPAKRLLRRDVLENALLGTIVDKASGPPVTAAGGG